MHRRGLLALPLLAALPRPGLAQAELLRGFGRQAIALAQAQRWAEADAAAASAAPPIRSYVTWLRLQARGSGATAAEIIGFALANPDWPAQEALTRRAEEALLLEADDSLAAQWFAARAPRSLDGYLRLAEALARAGRATEAEDVLRAGWAGAPADPAAGPADRPEADQPALAAAAPADAALSMERARWLRRQERDAEAGAVWLALTASPSAAAARAAWPERQVMARKLLRLGDARSAYAICAAHGIAAPGEPRQEAEFLAGFLALRKLGEAAAAERHFIRLGEESRSVITRARSLYWQGRAAAAQGQAARAREHYAAAAELPLAFYGQLASVALGEDAARLAARIAAAAPPAATSAQQQALDRHALTAVVEALADIGEARRARIFLLRLEELAPDLRAKALVVRLAHRIGRADHAVWVVRRAAASGLMLAAEGWPTPYPTPAEGTEPALVNAIARQESNFDPEAVSSANARGLMQLLPGTAQAVARRLGLRHQLGMLTADPAHNMRLGAAYLDQLQARFAGALPLAIAGYNAGPARVDEWLGTYGDPRSGDPGMLDWMEQIPFAETRNYVQRVLENLAIYRARDAATARQAHPMAAWVANEA